MVDTRAGRVFVGNNAGTVRVGIQPEAAEMDAKTCTTSTADGCGCVERRVTLDVYGGGSGEGFDYKEENKSIVVKDVINNKDCARVEPTFQTEEQQSIQSEACGSSKENSHHTEHVLRNESHRSKRPLEENSNTIHTTTSHRRAGDVTSEKVILSSISDKIDLRHRLHVRSRRRHSDDRIPDRTRRSRLSDRDAYHRAERDHKAKSHAKYSSPSSRHSPALGTSGNSSGNRSSVKSERRRESLHHGSREERHKCRRRRSLSYHDRSRSRGRPSSHHRSKEKHHRLDTTKLRDLHRRPSRSPRPFPKRYRHESPLVAGKPSNVPPSEGKSNTMEDDVSSEASDCTLGSLDDLCSQVQVEDEFEDSVPTQDEVRSLVEEGEICSSASSLDNVASVADVDESECALGGDDDGKCGDCNEHEASLCSSVDVNSSRDTRAGSLSSPSGSDYSLEEEGNDCFPEEHDCNTDDQANPVDVTMEVLSSFDLSMLPSHDMSYDVPSHDMSCDVLLSSNDLHESQDEKIFSYDLSLSHLITTVCCPSASPPASNTTPGSSCYTIPGSPSAPILSCPGTPIPGTPTPGTPGTPTPGSHGTSTPGNPGTPTPITTPRSTDITTPGTSTPRSSGISSPGTPTPSNPGTPTPGSPSTPTPRSPGFPCPGTPTPVSPGTPTRGSCGGNPGIPSPGSPGTPTPGSPHLSNPGTFLSSSIPDAISMSEIEMSSLSKDDTLLLSAVVQANTTSCIPTPSIPTSAPTYSFPTGGANNDPLHLQDSDSSDSTSSCESEEELEGKNEPEEGEITDFSDDEQIPAQGDDDNISLSCQDDLRPKITRITYDLTCDSDDDVLTTAGGGKDRDISRPSTARHLGRHGNVHSHSRAENGRRRSREEHRDIDTRPRDTQRRRIHHHRSTSPRDQRHHHHSHHHHRSDRTESSLREHHHHHSRSTRDQKLLHHQSMARSGGGSVSRHDRQTSSRSHLSRGKF